MNKGDVVTVMTVSGEFVGKLAEQADRKIVLEDPRYVVHGEQGMGFANGVALTGVQDPKTMTILEPVFICETNEEIVDNWRRATSGIVAPTSKIIGG